jgi:hypothetical protein
MANTAMRQIEKIQFSRALEKHRNAFSLDDEFTYLPFISLSK